MHNHGCRRRRGSRKLASAPMRTGGARSLVTLHRAAPEGEAHTYVWGLLLFVVAFNVVCFDLTRDAAAAADDELRAAVADALLPDRTTRP